jgi:hypothetical protein
MKAKDWEAGPRIDGHNYSTYENGLPIKLENKYGGAAFRMPDGRGDVDYVTTTAGTKGLADGKSLRLVYDLLGEGKLKPTGGGTTSARIRLHVQRKGDDWSGRGQYEHYRFWSSVVSVLEPGKDVVLECALNPDLWTGVYGKTNADGFKAVLKNCERMGFTFGGNFAGHGVSVKKGELTFVIKEFEVL